MHRVQTFLCFVFIFSLNVCFSQNLTIDTVNFNNYGWQAIVIENGYIKLAVFPEIGGRVLYYGFDNDEYMWINPDQAGMMYDPLTQLYGPWNGSSGYGGYKVWPAPQSRWNWPPPPYLAWGPYEFTTETVTADSIVLYLRSMVESQNAPGLQFARRFKVFSNSTLVKVEQVLINNNTDSQIWSIWDVTQTIVQHEGEQDYNNFSVYFPANINEITGSNNGNYSKVNECITRYNFQYGKSGKMYSFINKGWVSFVDERDHQSYSKLFEIIPGYDYPDDNANFEIYSSGGEYIEIEVLGPLREVGANGDSVVYNEYWCAAHINGNIIDANTAGIVKTQLNYNKTENKINGEFGIFNSGTIKLTYYDESGNNTGNSENIPVEAADNLVLNSNLALPENTVKIKLLCFDTHDNLIGVLDSCMVNDASFVEVLPVNTDFFLYPTVINHGDIIYYRFTDCVNATLVLEIYSLPEGRRVFYDTFKQNGTDGRFLPILPGKGLYIVSIKSESLNFVRKILVN